MLNSGPLLPNPLFDRQEKMLMYLRLRSIVTASWQFLCWLAVTSTALSGPRRIVLPAGRCPDLQCQALAAVGP
jgi:hypothetical protein